MLTCTQKVKVILRSNSRRKLCIRKSTEINQRAIKQLSDAFRARLSRWKVMGYRTWPRKHAESSLRPAQQCDKQKGTLVRKRGEAAKLLERTTLNCVGLLGNLGSQEVVKTMQLCLLEQKIR